MPRLTLPPQARSRGVTAVLGPTNTGKTHLAIERMLGHSSGMIGLPLRLLAREVYGRVVERAGADAVALVTGEEKIKPKHPRYWICTAEAMPRDLDLAFVAIDEIQLAADLDRGHVFTDRLLNQRGREETLLIGSSTMEPLVKALIPGVHVTTRPRLSQLTFAGSKKLSRLPARTAIVAFSAEEVYAIAELIRRQRGGAAVVLGALSPRTRNAQVALYQSGDVDYLVATDAIGMGLNLDVDHVAFAADRKFDGFRFRRLNPSEVGQIAGRAGRHLNDGTFGTSGRCDPFDVEIVEAVEGHRFEPARILQWRNPDLDFRSIDALQRALAEVPREHGLTRAPMAEDVAALEILARDDSVRHHASGRAAVERLWDVCQVPDYRKVSPQSHADLVSAIYLFLMRDGAVPDDWFRRHISLLDRVDGDIDTLSARIAQVRTWTFVANRPDWLRDPEHWQSVARGVEDKLSDALHERLASRFVDRRTSVLMRRLRENAMLEAEISASGDVSVEGQHVGRLSGFVFVPDPGATGDEAKTLRNAAVKGLAGEIEARADRFSTAADTTFVLSNDGTIRWQGEPVARLEPGEKIFEPRVRLIADEHLTGGALEKVECRLQAWLKAHVVRTLGPLLEMEDAADLTGIAKGIAYQIAEALGVLERSRVLQEVRGLDQQARAALRQKGIRFGAYHLYLPALMKPAPRTLAAQLWALKNGGLDQKGIDEIAALASSGRTSIPVDTEVAKGLYRSAGFRVCGGRAVRVDILERLADLIRPAIAYVPGQSVGEPPAGAAEGDGFVGTVAMTSLVGCAGEDFAQILRSLGYVSEERAGPAITSAILKPAPTTPVAPVPAPAASEAPAGEAAPEDAGAAEPDATDAPAVAEEQPQADAAEHPPEASPAEASPAEVASAEVAPVEMAETAVAAVEPEAEAHAETPAAPEAAVSEATLEIASEPVVAEAPAEEAAPSETEAGETEAGETDAVEAAPSEPAATETIVVWRQGRREGRGRSGRQGNRPGRDGRGPRREGAQAPGRQGGEPRREGGQGRRDAPGEGRDERRASGKGNGAGHGKGGGPGGGRKDVFRGADAPRGGGKDRGGPQQARPPRREKQADPDSPFAKLAALKAQLEEKK
ncbi:helicase-related protein [Salinarimonas rosea]|uniref:helicase-related protein n=1 Tax=Salinarimonas rosea TaxID=552063 RepID=UPI00048C04D2|nr:helicase-related protein [Salinarimonas rosea]